MVWAAGARFKFRPAKPDTITPISYLITPISLKCVVFLGKRLTFLG